jgi:hypothetical protein
MCHISDGAAQRMALLAVRRNMLRTEPHSLLAHDAQCAAHDVARAG